MPYALANLPTEVPAVARLEGVGVGAGVVDRIRKMLNWKFGFTATAAFELYPPSVKKSADLAELLAIARDSQISGLELAVYRLVMMTANERAIKRKSRAR